MKLIQMYDPPTGWKYGFPREYKPLENEKLKDTLIRDGYPKEDAGWASEYTRFWTRWEEK